MRTIVIATVLTFAPAFAFAMGCHGTGHETVASCPTGQSWDADSGSCVDTASS